MLTPGIHAAYARRRRHSGRAPPAWQRVARGAERPSAGCGALPALYQDDAAALPRQRRTLEDEIFGPASLIVACDDEAEMIAGGRARSKAS